MNTALPGRLGGWGRQRISIHALYCHHQFPPKVNRDKIIEPNRIFNSN